MTDRGVLEDHVIVGIHVTDRAVHAGQVQTALTEHGARIKTRIGLHETTGEVSSPNGMIILEMVGGRDASQTLMTELNSIDGVEAKELVFEH